MRFFDLHSDTPFECFKRGITLESKEIAVSVKYADLFEKWTQCFAVWIRDDENNPFALYNDILTDFKGKLNDLPKNMSYYLTVEGGAVIQNDLSRLYKLKSDGIAAITLTWNGKNAIASGCCAEGGLTDFGREAVMLMNKLEIACDLSHINKEGFWQALECTNYPIVTHACCSEIYKHQRNLNIDEIRAVAEHGGIFGICFYPEFLGQNDVFEQLYKNIYFLLDNELENHISIGSDFDGCKTDVRLSSLYDVPNLYCYLENKGIDNKILNKLFYENANRFFLKLRK